MPLTPNIPSGGGGGSGNVTGPSSSLNNDVALFDGTTGELLKSANFSLDDSGGVKSVDIQNRKLADAAGADAVVWSADGITVNHSSTTAVAGLVLKNDDVQAGYVNDISFFSNTYGTHKINVLTNGAENSGMELDGGSDYTQGASLQLGANNSNSGSIAITPGTPFGGFYIFDSTFSIFILGTSNDFVIAGVPFQMTQTYTPISLPGAQGNNLYFKFDGKLYSQDSTGTEHIIGPNTTGTATLVAGTVTVNSSEITANTRIMLTTNVPGGVIGTPYVFSRVVGASFTIKSTNIADTSQVSWVLFQS